MPKTSGIPKSILADINKLKTRLTSLEKNHNSLIKDFKSAIKSHSEMLKKQQKYHSPARDYNRTAWQEICQERETQTQ